MFDIEMRRFSLAHATMAIALFATLLVMLFAANAMTVIAAESGQEEKSDVHGGHMASDDKPQKKMTDHGEQMGIMHGDLVLTAAWVRQPPPSARTVGGYVTITNKGDEADRLLGGSADFAGKVEVHSMDMKDDVMIMRKVEGGLEIPAGETVELKPGGLHIMFMMISDPPVAGHTVPVTLEFERAGSIVVDLPVAKIGAKDMPAGHAHGALHK